MNDNNTPCTYIHYLLSQPAGVISRYSFRSHALATITLLISGRTMLTRGTRARYKQGRGTQFRSQQHIPFIFSTTTCSNDLRLRHIIHWYLLSNPASSAGVALLATLATCWCSLLWPWHLLPHFSFNMVLINHSLYLMY